MGTPSCCPRRSMMGWFISKDFLKQSTQQNQCRLCSCRRGAKRQGIIQCSSVATTALNPFGLKSSLGQETLEDGATDGLVRLMTSAMERMGMSRERYLENAVISFATDCSSVILYRRWQGASRGEGSQNCARYWALSSATETSVL